MAESAIHNRTWLQQEIHRLCSLLHSNPIEQIPLLELKNVIQMSKQHPSCHDKKLLPCTTILALIARAEIKRRLTL